MASEQNTVSDLRAKSRADLNHLLGELKQELFGLRFASAIGQLESHAKLRAVRKDIARVYTVIQERNLGIVSDPDQSEEV